jgi:hypothetical protein
MEQNDLEKFVQETAQLVKYVKKKMGLPIGTLERHADTYYPFNYIKRGEADVLTANLCSLLTDMKGKVRDEIVYNGKDKTSRRLADWWDAHQEADRKRVAAENAEIKRKALKEQAVKKLTKEERKALGIS